MVRNKRKQSPQIIIARTRADDVEFSWAIADDYDE